MSDAIDLWLIVNGNRKDVRAKPLSTLADVLRDRLHLTGTKIGCDAGDCGACTVLLDGAPVYPCSMLAIEAQGHAITTVEGLARDGKLSPVQRAFVDEDASMCGYCTPGFVLSVTGLLNQNPHPTAEEVKHACSGNLCRCGTYPRVLRAALKAAGVPLANKTEVISYASLA